jgi:hypothetical protein
VGVRIFRRGARLITGPVDLELKRSVGAKAVEGPGVGSTSEMEPRMNTDAHG